MKTKQNNIEDSIEEYIDYFIPEDRRGKELPGTKLHIPRWATGMFVDDTYNKRHGWYTNVAFYRGSKYLAGKRLAQATGEVRAQARRYLEKNYNTQVIENRKNIDF